MMEKMTVSHFGNHHREGRDPSAMSTATITEPVLDVAEPITGRSLISEQDFARVVARIVKTEDGFDTGLAESSVDQAIVFVATLARLHLAGTARLHHLGPSKSVDVGWHALLAGDTRVYRGLCESLGVPFVDHIPDDAADHELGDGEAEHILSRTAHVIAQHGYFVDPYMWGAEYARIHGTYASGCNPDQDSTGCHCGGNCG